MTQPTPDSDLPDVPEDVPSDVPVEVFEEEPEEPSFEARVSARVQALVDKVLDDADEIMRAGSPKSKYDFIKQVLPTLVKTLSTGERDSELEELRRNQERLFALMMESNPDPATLTPRPAVPDIPTDAAPGPPV